MAETRDEWIKKRAYALWEKEGYPTGRDFHHWEQASKEHDALKNTAASSDGEEVKAKARKPRAAAASSGNGAAASAPKKTTRKAASP